MMEITLGGFVNVTNFRSSGLFVIISLSKSVPMLPAAPFINLFITQFTNQFITPFIIPSSQKVQTKTSRDMGTLSQMIIVG